jgi:hypothetical protein
MKICSIDDCNNTHRARGFCANHYKRLMKWGDPLAMGRMGREVQHETCTVITQDNRICLKPHSANGMCQMHYRRVKLYGDPFARPRGHRKVPQTYVMVPAMGHPNSDSKGWISEHRLVMSNYLGRALLPGENVHHKNGNRKDNRIENLELWNTSQPKGQRIEDKVEYATEILKQYAPEKLKEYDDRSTP